jgi:acetylornithine deacetylase
MNPTITPHAPGRETLDAIRALVAFPTVSRDSNLELIEFVHARLAGLGAAIRLTYDDARRKANLLATLGPRRPGGILLSGHTDVVPVEGQPWETDPFAVVERDGRLYGRGTADMKGFLGCVLALAPEFVERGLAQPLHLAFSYDEEVGCLGAGRMIADLLASGLRPRACIVGEPTLMRPVIAHKGKRSYRCTVRGRAGHSAYAPHGVNAAEYAAVAVAYLRGLGHRRRDHGPRDASFDVPFTTVHTGILQGGTALNVIPHECRFEFEFRHLPGDDPDALEREFTDFVRERLEPEMRALDSQAGFALARLSENPALDTSAESEVAALARELSGAADFGKVSFASEASLFQRAGIPAVLCGPGSIEQAHRPNEYVTLEQIARCEAFLRRLAGRLCGP